MKDLYWKVLLHVHDPDAAPNDWGKDVNERNDNINEAFAKVNAMTNLELLEVISDLFDKE